MKKFLFFILTSFFVLPVFSQSSIPNDELILFMTPGYTETDLNDLMDELEMEVVEGPTANLDALLVKFIERPVIPAGGNPIGPITGGKQTASTKSKVVGVGFNYFVLNAPTNHNSTGDCSADILDSATQLNGGNSILTGIFDTGISDRARTQAVSYFDPANMGYNFINDIPHPRDRNGHGSHIASIIMSNLENENSAIQLKAYKTHNSNGTGNLFDVIKALDMAITDEVDIINMSFVYMEEKNHGTERKNPFKIAMHRAFDLSEMLIVAAAGNENLDNDFVNQLSGISAFPASFNNDNIISVASSNCALDKSSFSNFGVSSVDVFAPGENILGVNQYWNPITISGTSQATAFVTKLATYLGSHQQTFNWKTVKCAILNSTDPMNTTGYTLTEGLINSAAALDFLVNNPNNCDDATYHEKIENKEILSQPSLTFLTNNDIPTFEIVMEKEESATVSIVNINGQILVNEPVQLAKGRNIYTSDFPKTGSIGLYFIMIQTKDGKQTLKFIK